MTEDKINPEICIDCEFGNYLIEAEPNYICLKCSDYYGEFCLGCNNI